MVIAVDYLLLFLKPTRERDKVIKLPCVSVECCIKDV
jgi:hypothetical protein